MIQCNSGVQKNPLLTVSSAPIEQASANLGTARALAVAIQFGVFTHIAEGKRTVAQIAQDAKASERGIQRLLNVLVSLEFLTRLGDSYELTPVASEYLVRGKPFYVGLLMEGDWLWESWGRLYETVRTGTPFRHVDEPTEEATQFFKALIPTLHVANLPGARRAARVLLTKGLSLEGLHVIDIACGSAVWSIAIAEATGATTQVIAQDLASVLELTRRYLKLHGVENQYEFLPGDQRRLDFGANRFDLALIARYLHELGAESACDLFRRVFIALKPGGRIVVADWMPNNERTGPPGPLLYALRMLLHTDEGDAHTGEDYVRWLGSVGFTQIELTPDIGPDVPLITATKP
jgi:ubiquinone/menaquinone biosynthesis C-methylase UbiE